MLGAAVIVLSSFLLLLFVLVYLNKMRWLQTMENIKEYGALKMETTFFPSHKDSFEEDNHFESFFFFPLVRVINVC